MNPHDISFSLEIVETNLTDDYVNGLLTLAHKLLIQNTLTLFVKQIKFEYARLVC